jgi:hypothetical protein
MAYYHGPWSLPVVAGVGLESSELRGQVEEESKPSWAFARIIINTRIRGVPVWPEGYPRYSVAFPMGKRCGACSCSLAEENAHPGLTYPAGRLLDVPLKRVSDSTSENPSENFPTCFTERTFYGSAWFPSQSGGKGMLTLLSGLLVSSNQLTHSPSKYSVI